MVAACQGGGGGAHHHDQATSADAAVAAADWNNATVVSVELRDYGFVPREIRLRAGRPYRIDFYNSGGNTHYFNAPELFRAIATYKVEIPNHAEVKADSFKQFEIARRGGQLSFFFIPLSAGSYRFHCHIENHAELGVEGVLIIE